MSIAMNKPSLYNSSNELQRKSTIKSIEENSDKIKWKDAGDTAIDVGCGDGSVSVLVRNYKPHNNYFYKKYVACDINENMVKFAQEHYGHEDISFRVLDIGGDLPVDLRGSFNHVFSFYALHWVKDQEKAFRNIYNLLTDNGDIFINLLASNAIYSVYKLLADQPKWRSWLKHVDIFISPYHDMANPEKIVADILNKIGFKNVDVQCKSLKSVYHTTQELKRIIQSVEPFNMPQDVFDDLIEDGFSLAKELGIFNFFNGHVTYSYKLLVLNAHK